jgi:hypothetical protein
MLRRSVFVSVQLASRGLARVPQTVPARPSAFVLGLRPLATEATEATKPTKPTTPTKISGYALFSRETRENRPKGEKAQVAWDSLSDARREEYLIRAENGEGAKPVFAWPKLFPREVTISPYLAFVTKNRGKSSNISVLATEWRNLSDAEKAKYPTTKAIKHAPKLLSEIYPKKVKVASFPSFIKESSQSLRDAADAWKTMSDAEKAKYAGSSYVVEKPASGADFKRFFRLHKKSFMKKNLIELEKDARVPLKDYWTNQLTDEQRAEYAL